MNETSKRISAAPSAPSCRRNAALKQVIVARSKYKAVMRARRTMHMLEDLGITCNNTETDLTSPD